MNNAMIITIGDTFFFNNLQHNNVNNKATLRAVNKYIESDKLLKSLTFFQVIGRGLKRLFRIKDKNEK